MIDTGATGSVLREGLAAQLGLNPVGITYINTPSSTNVTCHECLVRLVFPNNVLFETTVLEAPLQGQHIQCLIGRDVLARGIFAYIGYGNLFSLSPSGHKYGDVLATLPLTGAPLNLPFSPQGRRKG
jgi:hypothetical protein